MLYELSFFVMYSVTLLLLLFIVRSFFRGGINGYYFVIPVFIFFYILPSLVDFLTGDVFLGPAYSPAAYEALSDETTTLIYNLYVTITLVLFYFFSQVSRVNSYSDYEIKIKSAFDNLKKYQLFVWVIIFLPFIFAVLSADFSFYLEYTKRIRASANFFQELAAKFSIVSIVLIAILLPERVYRFKKNKNLVYVIVIAILVFFAVLNSYIHGKRSVVALFLFLTIAAFFITKSVTRKTLVKLTLFSSIIFYVFLIMYGKNTQGALGLLELAKELRIDFSRDYSLKFVIYHELLNNESVLPYAGASYLFLLTFFIPREVWDEKPYPYAVYLTNSFFGDFGGSYMYGWGLTTSFVAEAVSNLGFFGLLLFPIFYIYFLIKADKLKVLGLKVLAYLIATLLLLVHPVAIITLILLFLLFLFLSKFRIVINKG
ncbi:hypothetical protein [Pseudoalteromonas sp. OF7H-1]|uniref:hypothetical protein n=1 Tax=Pseudoalteromonas sp. OF7H-1 TaxID=2917755 RepID=UPI001EF6BF09|nr:hypothetical protein [Pseudoalteromonas sp. OF7H-1]MCG7538909.1 hypothetical protein [Pseudoalteromonas sp. OF7H-1]